MRFENLLLPKMGRTIMWLTFLLSILSCEKERDLGPKFVQLKGTYLNASSDTRITIDNKQRLIAKYNTERGFSYKIQDIKPAAQPIINYQGYMWYGIALANGDKKGKRVAIHCKTDLYDTVLIYVGPKNENFTAYNNSTVFIKQ